MCLISCVQSSSIRNIGGYYLLKLSLQLIIAVLVIVIYSNPPIISDFFLSDLGAQSSKQLSDLGATEKGITYMVFF